MYLKCISANPYLHLWYSYKAQITHTYIFDTVTQYIAAIGTESAVILVLLLIIVALICVRRRRVNCRYFLTESVHQLTSIQTVPSLIVYSNRWCSYFQIYRCLSGEVGREQLISQPAVTKVWFSSLPIWKVAYNMQLIITTNNNSNYLHPMFDKYNTRKQVDKI